MTSYVDKLSEFGKSFQVKVIYSLIHDIKFLQDIFDIVDSSYFESEEHQWIVEQIIKYYNEYKSCVTMEVLALQVKSIQSTSFQTSIKNSIKEIYTTEKLDDIEFIKDQFENFCKNQKLKTAILSSTELLKQGKYEDIKHLVDDALKAGMSKDFGHDWTEHVEVRLNNVREVSPTHMEAIDNITNGGLSGGEIGIVAAPSGVGKTWVLCQLGYNAVKNGKNVLHITLELSDDYVARRYDTILTGKPFSMLQENSDILKEQLKNVKGHLDIRAFPTRGLSVTALEGFVERVSQVRKIDLIILDYADLMDAGKKSTGNTYDDMGTLYEELRGISGNLGIPLWTATQTNRDSLSVDVIGAQGIADSYKKVMTADFIMSIIRKDVDKLSNKARVHVIKNRFGPDGMTFNADMDTMSGKFHIYDQVVDNQKVEKEQESLEKKQLSEKYKSFSSKNKVSNDFG